MKRSLWIVVSLLAIFVVGCSSPEHDAHSEPAATPDVHEEGHVELSPEAMKIAGIEIGTVGYRMIQDGIDVPGVVNSTTKGRAVVTPPVAGRIVSISVSLGDTVRQGQTLAVIESPELAQSWSSIADAQHARDVANADLKQAVAEADLSRAKLSAARISLKRQQDFAKAGAFNQAPVQQAQSELNDAQSELLSIQKEQASHAEQFRRIENLFKDGIVSKSELEAARLELQQDEIRLNRVQARVDMAKRTYEREKSIADKGLLNAKELQTAEAEVRSAELEREKSEIRIRSAKAALANANRAVANAQAVYRSNSGSVGASVGRVSLTAPIAGVVTHLDITQGQAVDRTQTILEVENLDAVWVTANVPEQDSAIIAKGATVSVAVASMPGKTFEGVVQSVGSRIDPKTRSMPVQCLIANAGGALKPDMFAKVRVGTGASTKHLAVPQTSILTEDRDSFVFVKEGGAFEKRKVELGSQDGNFVAIVSGLKEGEEIATTGVFILSSELKKAELKGHDH
ncbi:MAG: efflux RND transporter periplasmic adaptor subunit [Fimbriimonadaceae bacterium]|nr:efflux RND transporter periplasmic adaptor subunit [Fimbriimonadaceae bacterium]